MFQLTIILSFISVFLALENSVAYPGVGTSKLNDFFQGFRRRVAARSSSVSPKFLLYTRQNLNQPQQLSWENPQHNKETNFHSKRPTKFIIHGFMDNIKISGWTNTMKSELLTKRDFNVIIVDWSGSNGQPYAQATINARIVGGEVDNLIKSLQVILLF